MTSIWPLNIIREMQKTGEYYISITMAKIKTINKDMYEMLIAALLVIALKLETQRSINSRMDKESVI